MKRIINHFTDDDLYKLTMCCAVIDNFPRAQVKYQFTDRDRTVYPPGFAEELMEQVAMLEDVAITEEEIDFMPSLQLHSRMVLHLPERLPLQPQMGEGVAGRRRPLVGGV